MEGTGTIANPIQISATRSDITGLLVVTDTASVDMTLAGAGSDADPYRLSAVADPALTELRDVGGAAPAPGHVPTWVAAAGGNPARFEFRPTGTVPVGSITVGAGISGDGSAGSPLAVRTAGVWGSGVLAGFGADSTIGSPTYVDSAGNIRTQPRGIDVVANAGAAIPAAYPGRMYVRADTGQLFWSNGSTWAPTFTPSNPTSLDASVITSGVLDIARVPTGTSATTVAFGNHTHAGTDITSGIVAFARLPVGTIAGSVAAGNHSHAATAISSNGLGFSTNVDAAITWLNTYKADAGSIPGGSVADSVTSAAFNRNITSGYYAMYMGNGTLIGRNTSSARYKDQIVAADVDVEDVLALQPVEYHHVDDPDAGDRHLGLIAEDCVDVPYLVAYDYERDTEGNPVPDAELRPETVRYENVLPVLLLAVVKHQDEQIRALQGRVELLEGL